MPRIYGSNPPLKRIATHHIIIIFYCYYYAFGILHIHYCYKWKLYYSESVNCAKLFLEKNTLKVGRLYSQICLIVTFFNACHFLLLAGGGV